MKLRSLSAAEKEASEAALWYEDRRIGLGDEFFLALAETTAKIAATPSRFEVLPTSRAKGRVRRAPMSRFPYSVIYKLESDEIVVVAVAHASRRPSYWEGRLHRR